MLSRQTIYVLGQQYASAFRVDAQFNLNRMFLHDFLYVWDFEERELAFMTANATVRQLAEFVMAQDTTTAMHWKTHLTASRRKGLGHELLLRLAGASLATEARAVRPHFLHTKALRRRLELDGYEVRDDGRVIKGEAEVLDTQETVGALKQALTDVGLWTPEVDESLRLSEEHYVSGRWADSISNSRKVMEETMRNIANAHEQKVALRTLKKEILESPREIREYLEKAGLLEPEEKRAYAGAYGLLSHQGSHPYIADQDQARLLRHVALTYTQFLLLQWAGRAALP